MQSINDYNANKIWIKASMHKVLLKELTPYHDALGNSTHIETAPQKCRGLAFNGSNNTLIIEKGVRLSPTSSFTFNLNNAIVKIGSNSRMSVGIVVGEKCKVTVGERCTTTNKVTILTSQEGTVTLGDDCMLATNCLIRACDAHSIYSVITGTELNYTKNIAIGNHVWLASDIKILGGTSIGDGSIVATGAIVKGTFPNNCIIAGVPAKIAKRHTAWERPHKNSPSYTAMRTEQFWKLTREPLSLPQKFLLQLFAPIAWACEKTDMFAQYKNDPQAFFLQSQKQYCSWYKRIINACGPPIF